VTKNRKGSPGDRFAHMEVDHLAGLAERIMAGKYIDGPELAERLRGHGSRPIPDTVLDYLCRYLEGNVDQPKGRKALPEFARRRLDMIIDGLYRLYFEYLMERKRRYGHHVGWTKLKYPLGEMAARRVPAGDIERLVEERLIAFLKDGSELHGALAERNSEAHAIETLIAEASNLAELLLQMPSVEKRQWLQSLIARITLKPESLEIGIRIAQLADIPRNGEEIGAREPMALPDQSVLVLTISARLKRTGMEKKLLIGVANNGSGNKADASLLKLIARAHELQEIFTRGGRPISEMAREAGLSSSYFTRMLRLSFLAPDITRAILHGRQPTDLTARKLMADTRAPIVWHEQHAGLGLV